MSLWARESASSTAKPMSRSMAATALLPLAIPPVSPRRRMTVKLSRAGGRLCCRKFGRGSPQARGLHGIAHEHRDGHGTNAAGDGRERPGGVDGVGMDVADEDAAFRAEFFQPLWKIPKQALRFLGIGDAVRAHIDDGGAHFDPLRFHEAGFDY